MGQDSLIARPSEAGAVTESDVHGLDFVSVRLSLITRLMSHPLVSYSDVDTLIVNPFVELEAFLPPPDDDRAFLLITK